jgi:hypothetical protein
LKNTTCDAAPQVDVRPLQHREVDAVAVERLDGRLAQRCIDRRRIGVEARPLRGTGRREVEGSADIEAQCRRGRLGQRDLVRGVGVRGAAAQHPVTEEVGTESRVDRRAGHRVSLAREEAHQRQALAHRHLGQPRNRAQFGERGVVAQHDVRVRVLGDPIGAIDAAAGPTRTRGCRQHHRARQTDEQCQRAKRGPSAPPLRSRPQPDHVRIRPRDTASGQGCNPPGGRVLTPPKSERAFLLDIVGGRSCDARVPT